MASQSNYNSVTQLGRLVISLHTHTHTHTLMAATAFPVVVSFILDNNMSLLGKSFFL